METAAHSIWEVHVKLPRLSFNPMEWPENQLRRSGSRSFTSFFRRHMVNGSSFYQPTSGEGYFANICGRPTVFAGSKLFSDARSIFGWSHTARSYGQFSLDKTADFTSGRDCDCTFEAVFRKRCIALSTETLTRYTASAVPTCFGIENGWVH